MASIEVRDGMTEEQEKMIRELYGDPTASDEMTALVDRLEVIRGKEMSKLARMGGGPVTVGLHSPGERKTLGDGRTFEVGEDGRWFEVKK